MILHAVDLTPDLTSSLHCLQAPQHARFVLLERTLTVLVSLCILYDSDLVVIGEVSGEPRVPWLHGLLYFYMGPGLTENKTG